MFYSLRFGILLAMLAVPTVAIATVIGMVSITTRTQFAEYLAAGREIQEERLEGAVVVWGDPDNVMPEIDLSSLRFLTEGIPSEASNFRIRTVGAIGLLEEVDNDENSATVTTGEGDMYRLETAPNGEVRVFSGQDAVGSVLLDPVDQLELDLLQENFFSTLNWTLLVTTIVASMAAIALTVILSRRILHPVAELTLAARRMESGDLDQRVQVNATGEIGELSHAFNAMAEALSRTEALRRNMVTDIAHELRTPLTNIRGYLEALQDGVLDADEDTITMLHDEAMLLNRLIQDLQELALAEAGALHYELQEIDIGNIIEQTLAASQQAARQKHITLKGVEGDSLPSVIADQRRVAQILRNLVNNAITHTPPEGEVQINAVIYPNEVEISVRDSGNGINPEHLPYLFERFYRADPSRSRSTGGAGLGLAIVKNLVEAQGGRVQVDSMRGQGATFSFTLPRPAIR